jgi:hypothetical protein
MISEETGFELEGDRQQHGDGCRGADAGQHADQCAENDADQAETEVPGRSGRGKAEREIVRGAP